MGSIKFGGNYNGKFDNNSFLAVRKENSIYKVGSNYKIEVRSAKHPEKFLHFGDAELVSLKTIRFSDLTEFHSYLDLDMPLDEYKAFLIRSYRKMGISIQGSRMNILIFRFGTELNHNNI